MRYFITNTNDLARVDASHTQATVEDILRSDFSSAKEHDYAVEIFSGNGDTYNNTYEITEFSAEGAVIAGGGYKADIGEFKTIESAVKAMQEYIRSDIELNPMNINGTVNTYYELENGDMLEIRHADPDGEFPPKDPTALEAYNKGIWFNAVVYDREKLEAQNADPSECIKNESFFFSTNLQNCGLELKGDHMVSVSEPAVTMDVRSAIDMIETRNRLNREELMNDFEALMHPERDFVINVNVLEHEGEYLGGEIMVSGNDENVQTCSFDYNIETGSIELHKYSEPGWLTGSSYEIEVPELISDNIDTVFGVIEEKADEYLETHTIEHMPSIDSAIMDAEKTADELNSHCSSAPERDDMSL